MSNIYQIEFIGHPFASIGKGEELRSSFSSMRFVNPDCKIYDVYKYIERNNADYIKLCEGTEVEQLTAPVRVFHINGDEVEGVVNAIEQKGNRFEDAYNIIVPAWELPVYPSVWVDNLKRFDEVWSISHFVNEGIEASGVSANFVGQAVEIPVRSYLSRSYFGIRPSSFVFITFLDVSSYIERKNPKAVLEMFRKLRNKHPYLDMQLVVKVKNAESSAAQFVAELQEEYSLDIIFIDMPLTTYEVHSLIAACDCFLSLHRAEGFGRGAGEAMWLGRPALATGWSGNMDYMQGYEGAIDYTLVDVLEGQYVHGEGQVWAEPDVDHALYIADKLVTDFDFYRNLAISGQQAVYRECSFRAVGLRMLSLLEQLDLNN